MKKIFLSVAMLLGMAPVLCLAEGGCPEGYYPQNGAGWQGCAPGPGVNDSGAGTPRIVVNGYWENKWGALAVSRAVDNSSVSVTGQPSENAAKLFAINECKKRGGGTGCQVDYTYRNGCVAVANSLANLGFIETATNVDDASRLALKKCTNASGGKCSIGLTDCSQAIYHKY